MFSETVKLWTLNNPRDVLRNGLAMNSNNPRDVLRNGLAMNSNNPRDNNVMFVYIVKER